MIKQTPDGVSEVGALTANVALGTVSVRAFLWTERPTLEFVGLNDPHIVIIGLDDLSKVHYLVTRLLEYAALAGAGD